ncbi:MAG: T9SS type A sorting domain-containing protein [Bacteroidales bacterium]
MIKYSLQLLLLLFTVNVSAQTFTRIGNAEDVTTNHEQGFLLMGGGGDNFDGLEWFYNLADEGDVVIIRYDAGTGYNDDYDNYPMNSITTIESINTTEKANNPEVEAAIMNAEAVFIPGGNQWNYYNTWKGTMLHDALLHLINEKNGSIGGTSAGLAVLGEFLFTAENNTVYSSEALANPYNFRMTIADDFLNIPILESIITDSHFNRLENNETENRHGRLFTFLARINKDWDRNPALGIGVNEYTAVGVESTGNAYVFGDPNYDDYAYFLATQDCEPETCETNVPLTWSCNQQAVKVAIVKGKKSDPDYFDLTSWDDCSECDWEYWYADEGELYKTDETTATPINSIDQKSLYPNPASRLVTFSAGNRQIKSFAVYSATGQNVFKRSGITNENVFSIDVSNLSPGVYIIKASTKTGNETMRFVVSR